MSVREATGTVFLFAAVVIIGVYVAVTRRGERRRAAARRAARLAAARREAGMPAGHPEEPGPPSGFEATWFGDTYAAFARQLADITVDER